MPRGTSTRTPCEECKSRSRHHKGCSKWSPSKSGVSRDPEKIVDYIKDKIKELPDGWLAATLRACVDEAGERRAKIEREAAARIAALDEVLKTTRAALPVSGQPTPVTAMRGDVKPAPQNMQCGALFPENVEIKCTQPKSHDGQHYNHNHKKSWQRRVA